MAQLSRMLSCLTRRGHGDQGADALEEPQWYVGCRYQVLLPVDLHAKPDLKSNLVGSLLPRDVVLFLALQAIPSADGCGEVVLAYLANTSTGKWICGWGQLYSSTPCSPSVALRRQSLRGSWEVGGRYRVVHSPLMRTCIKLESEEVVGLKPKEEVLLLELGLVLCSGEARLRARVRADGGQIGWITVEVDGKQPMLDPLNLYSDAAVKKGTLFCGIVHEPALRCPSSCRARLTVAGMREGVEQGWEIGGKYRTLGKVQLRQYAELEGPAIGVLERGALVHVRNIVFLHYGKRGRWKPRDTPCLQVIEETKNGLSNQGWIAGYSANKELLLDVRDHLEYEKLLGSTRTLTWGPTSEVTSDCDPTSRTITPRARAPSSLCPVLETEGLTFTVDLDRTTGSSLGIHVDQEEDTALLVSLIEQGGLIDAWNTKYPQSQVCPGDRIVAANGKSGSAMELLAELQVAKNTSMEVFRPPCHRQRADTSGVPDLPGPAQRYVPPLVFPPPTLHTYCVHIDRSFGTSLGITAEMPDGRTFRIDEIEPGGLIEKWNAENPLVRVCPGDYIVAVNGVHGQERDLSEALGVQQPMTLTLQRVAIADAASPEPPSAVPCAGGASGFTDMSSVWDIQNDPFRQNDQPTEGMPERVDAPQPWSEFDAVAAHIQNGLRMAGMPDDDYSMTPLPEILEMPPLPDAGLVEAGHAGGTSQMHAGCDVSDAGGSDAPWLGIGEASVFPSAARPLLRIDDGPDIRPPADDTAEPEDPDACLCNAARNSGWLTCGTERTPGWPVLSRRALLGVDMPKP